MENKLAVLQTYLSADYLTRLHMFLETPGLRHAFTRLEINRVTRENTSRQSVRKTRCPLLRWAAAAVGILSLMLLLVFLVAGPVFSLNFNLGQDFGIVFDIILCMLFFFSTAA